MNVHWERTGVPRTASTPLEATGVAAMLDTLSTVMASLVMVHSHVACEISIMLCKISQKLMNVLPIPPTPASRFAPTLLEITLVNAIMDSG